MTNANAMAIKNENGVVDVRELTSVDLHRMLLEAGYHTTLEMAETISLVLKYEGKGLGATFLKGPAGAGKTFMVETLEKKLGYTFVYYQAVSTTSDTQLYSDIDISGIVEGDKDKVYKYGALAKAIQVANQGKKVLLVLDEWDKTRDDADAFLLDFLQSGRLSETPWGTLEVEDTKNITVFICANNNRELSEPLMRRLSPVYLDYPSVEVVREALLTIEDADVKMLMWVLKMYSVQKEFRRDIRKVCTIQEMKNVLLDDIHLIKEKADVNRRIKNAIRWLAQYEDDIKQVKTWAKRIPFGGVKANIKEEQGEREELTPDQIFNGAEFTSPEILKRLAAMEDKIVEVASKIGTELTPDGYSTIHKDYNIHLTINEGDVFEMNGMVLQSLTSRTISPNDYEPFKLKIISEGRITEWNVHHTQGHQWDAIPYTKTLPKFSPLKKTALPEIKLKESDVENIEENFMAAGILDSDTANKYKLHDKTEELSNNSFKAGNYYFIKKSNCYAIYWNGENLNSDIDNLDLLSNAKNLICSFDISYSTMTTKQKLRALPGIKYILQVGEDDVFKFRLEDIDNSRYDLLKCSDEAMITPEKLIVKIKCDYRAQGIEKLYNLLSPECSEKNYILEKDWDSFEPKDWGFAKEILREASPINPFTNVKKAVISVGNYSEDFVIPDYRKYRDVDECMLDIFTTPENFGKKAVIKGTYYSEVDDIYRKVAGVERVELRDRDDCHIATYYTIPILK